MTDISFRGGRIDGTVRPPSSKSHTHRAIILSALSGGRCTVTDPLLSYDTLATADAVRQMGTSAEVGERRIIIDGRGLHAPSAPIDVKNSGTTLRLMTGICSLFPERTVLTGDESIRKRPMGPLLESLSACGVDCRSNGGKPPVEVKGPVTGDRLEIDGSVSSQFVSSLIMLSPMTGRRMTVHISGKAVSRPYIDITTRMMRRFGASVTEDDGTFTVEPTGYRPADYAVPADFSSAAFPLVMGALGGRITAEGLDLSDAQGDSKIIDILKDVGCRITVDGDRVTCERTGRPKAADIDLADIPDLFPVIAVLMATAEGTSRLYGAPHLRFKESDRIALTEAMLRNLGADITGTDDGCIINGVRGLRGGRIEHDGDHRIAMAAAVASVIADGPVSMEDDSCWNVSYPDFPSVMGKVGLEHTVGRPGPDRG